MCLIGGLVKREKCVFVMAVIFFCGKYSRGRMEFFGTGDVAVRTALSAAGRIERSGMAPDLKSGGALKRF